MPGIAPPLSPYPTSDNLCYVKFDDGRTGRGVSTVFRVISRDFEGLVTQCVVCRIMHSECLTECAASPAKVSAAFLVVVSYRSQRHARQRPAEAGGQGERSIDWPLAHLLFDVDPMHLHGAVGPGAGEDAGVAMHKDVEHHGDKPGRAERVPDGAFVGIDGRTGG